MEYVGLIGSYGRLTGNISNYLRSEILGSRARDLTLDLALDLTLDTDPGSDPDWLQDRPQESLISDIPV